MNAIAMWKDLFANLRWQESSVDQRPSPAFGRGSDPVAARETLRQTIAALRAPEPFGFSDAPDHDFVALLDFYGAAFGRLAAGAGRSLSDPDLRTLTAQAEERRRRHVAWSLGWRLRSPLGSAWVLDAASVRLRFTHQRLRHDLAFEPGDRIEFDYAFIVTALSHRSADLCQAAGDLCRDREVRDYASETAAACSSESREFRDWLLDRRSREGGRDQGRARRVSSELAVAAG